MHDLVVLDELVKMSLELARPEYEFVVLGEGNTSAKIDDNTFWVKASGKYLSKSDRETFVKVRLQQALAILDEGELSDEEIKDALFAACVDPANQLKPSVETTFHAFLLSIPDVNFVGHTHPTAVNSILCSKKAKDAYAGRLFPDEIVYCGIEPIFIDYVDPGLELARVIRARCYDYIDRHGVNPKVILIQNHGFIAVGKSAHEVEAVTIMGVKAAKVLAGTYQFGGPRFFSQENVDRIYTRPDEHYRRQQFQ
jgi:rhamnose utilization protein RhaD (predicted bifunctional aldolase and dehydrogenase)